MLENKFKNYKLIKNGLIWLGLALGLFLVHPDHSINSDEGLILNAAWNIINHKKLYIDSFEFIAPGAPYLLAAWWKITGVSYLSAASLGYLVNLASLIGLYLISKKLNIKRWRFFAPTAFVILSALWPPITHNSFNVMAIVWASYFLFETLNKKNYSFLAAGLFSGLAILFTQHRGLVATGVFICYLAYLKINKKINYLEAVFFLAGLLIPLGCLFIFWSPQILYQNLIVFPALNYLAVNFLPLRWWIINLILTGVIIFNCWLFLNQKIKNKAVLLSCLGLSLLMTSLLRADLEHIFQSLIIILPLFSLMLEIYFTKIKDRPAIYCLMIMLVLVLIDLSWPPFNNFVPKKIIKIINQNCPPIKRVYAGPFLPGIYFETRTLNLTPYSMLITKQETDEQFDEALGLLKKNPPNCVIINYALVEKFFYNKNNPIEDFLNKNYKRVDGLGNLDVLIPN